MASDALNFDSLVAAIERTHSALAEQASKAVNISLTLRNWMIGYYIQEYEQSGTDRAAYGERLLESLAERLQSGGLKRVEARELRRFRQFYLAYPQIRETASPELAGGQATLPTIWQTLSAKLASTAGDIREAASPESGRFGHSIQERGYFISTDYTVPRKWQDCLCFWS